MFNVLQHLGDALQLRQVFEVERFFPFGEVSDRHFDALLPAKEFDDLRNRSAAESIKAVFGKLASPFAQRLAPGNVMKGHRVGDGSIAVEKVGAEIAGRNRKLEVHLTVYL